MPSATDSGTASSADQGVGDRPNWPLLAGLRFILALIVAMSHIAFVLNRGSYAFYESLGPIAAVMVFFAISGYSMRHSYAREPEGFYRRRFWRIAPLHWVGCIGVVLPYLIWGRDYTVIVAPGQSASWPMAPWPVYLSQFFGLFPALYPYSAQGFNGPMWSLGCEAAFYVMVPRIAKTPRNVLWMVTLLSVALIAVYVPRNSWWTGYAGYIGFFLLGWMLPDYREQKWFVALGTFLFAASSIILMTPADQKGRGETYAPILAACAWLVLCLSPRLTVPARLRGFANYLGDISFPLYIIHLPLAWCLLPLYLPKPYSSNWVVAGYAVIVSAVLLHIVDKPLRRYGRQGLAWGKRVGVVAGEG